jgi:hypothetical protein
MKRREWLSCCEPIGSGHRASWPRAACCATTGMLCACVPRQAYPLYPAHAGRYFARRIYHFPIFKFQGLLKILRPGQNPKPLALRNPSLF